MSAGEIQNRQLQHQQMVQEQRERAKIWAQAQGINTMNTDMQIDEQSSNTNLQQDILYEDEICCAMKDASPQVTLFDHIASY